MSSTLDARAADLVGSVLDRRKVPLGIARWPDLARHLHPTPTALLDTYWPLRVPDQYHLYVWRVRRIAEEDTALWLIRHDLLQIASGPDGTFVVLSNDDELRVKYISMQESIGRMEEDALPPPETICDLDLDVFALLRHLRWMSQQCIDGAFPDRLQMPIPLDFYDARAWRAKRDEQQM